MTTLKDTEASTEPTEAWYREGYKQQAEIINAGKVQLETQTPGEQRTPANASPKLDGDELWKKAQKVASHSPVALERGLREKVTLIMANTLFQDKSLEQIANVSKKELLKAEETVNAILTELTHTIEEAVVAARIEETTAWLRGFELNNDTKNIMVAKDRISELEGLQETE